MDYNHTSLKESGIMVFTTIETIYVFADSKTCLIISNIPYLFPMELAQGLNMIFKAILNHLPTVYIYFNMFIYCAVKKNLCAQR